MVHRREQSQKKQVALVEQTVDVSLTTMMIAMMMMMMMTVHHLMREETQLLLMIDYQTMMIKLWHQR
jgi:hypothetical protein